MKTVDQTLPYAQLTDGLSHKGCFLVTGGDKPNVMTVGWTLTGIMWGRPVLMAPVRPSRYSHVKLDALKEFTICVPDGMAKELAFCGSKSGRDVDKAAELALKLLPSEKVSAPYIDGCKAVYECKVLYQLDMTKDAAAAATFAPVDERFYPSGDYHTLYFAEIVNCKAAE